MKCEIKYIERKVKEDYKTITIRGILIVAIISFTMAFVLSLFLSDFTTYLLLALFFILISYVVWKDAVIYCKNRKIMNENILH